MNTSDLKTLSAAVALAAGASALTGMLVAPTAAVETQAASGPAMVKLEAQLAELTAAQTELVSRIGRLDGAASSRREIGGVDAAVERWIAANAPGLRTAESKGTAEVTPGEVDELLDSILTREFGDEGERAFWTRIGKLGHTDAVLAAMEKLAKRSPHDAKVQQALAETYVAKSYEIGMGPARIALSAKADAAFDSALAVDETLWGARFGKAIELSKLPSMMGKASAAIEQFEILVGQQEQRRSESRFAQSYFYLGNLYQESGKSVKAAAAWRRGLEFFPDDARLRDQLAMADKGVIK